MSKKDDSWPFLVVFGQKSGKIDFFIGCFEPTMVLNFQRKLLREELVRSEKKSLIKHTNNVNHKHSVVKTLIPERFFPSIVLHCRYYIRKANEKVSENYKVGL